jgi:hypothetical protein
MNPRSTICLVANSYFYAVFFPGTCFLIEFAFCDSVLQVTHLSLTWWVPCPTQVTSLWSAGYLSPTSNYGWLLEVNPKISPKRFGHPVTFCLHTGEVQWLVLSFFSFSLLLCPVPPPPNPSRPSFPNVSCLFYLTRVFPMHCLHLSVLFSSTVYGRLRALTKCCA